MQSNASTVDAYIEEADETRKPYLVALRDLCREVLAGYDEGMAYGMAGYSKNGAEEVGFANQKQYISVYFLKAEVVKQNLPLLRGLNVGKSCIRYPNPKKMDLTVLRKILEDTLHSDETPC
jgi:uncharacterized protein YdhG (YjbR/CyaY superfamily)